MATDVDLELLETLLPGLPPPPPLEEKLHPTFQKFFEGKTHLKHPAQESSILGYLGEANLLSTDILYIDLGAGKARIDEHIFRILGIPLLTLLGTMLASSWWIENLFVHVIARIIS